jgi:putative aldouronate transport system permease protein
MMTNLFKKKIQSREEIEHEFLLEDLERTRGRRIWQQIRKHWPIYAMLIPVLVFFFLFRYRPIYGLMNAFIDNSRSSIGLLENDYTGLFSFIKIMFDPIEKIRFWQAFRNTFTISMYGLLFGFPVPILLALMFSEIRNERIRSVTQIITYLPKFISTVVITSIIVLIASPGNNAQGPGLLNRLMTDLGWVEANTSIMSQPQFFRSIYIISGIWEGAGYGSIVYFAAIMAINPTNYEAARIDGASKMAQIRYITFPGMAATLTIMLILRVGEILSVGYEKIILLTANSTIGVQTTAEVISTYVLSLGGLLEGSLQMSYGSAADLFNSLIAMFLVLGSNYISRRVSDTSLF